MNNPIKYETLISQIKVLSETIWEGRANEQAIVRWLENFGEGETQQSDDKLKALYLLSRFTYLGNREVKETLRALYRDLIVYPIVESIRKRENGSRDLILLRNEMDKELAATRFLAAGNPSESGAHLLYFFRQVNRLDKRSFIHAMEASEPPHSSKAHRFIFIDDFCGTGRQAVGYAGAVVAKLRKIVSECTIEYYVLAGTTDGLNHVRANTSFDRVDTVIELDSSFKCFDSTSRYFDASEVEEREQSKGLALEFGRKLQKNHPLGNRESQLLIAFTHNTPNNTLPIFWVDSRKVPWYPIFRRHPKRL